MGRRVGAWGADAGGDGGRASGWGAHHEACAYVATVRGWRYRLRSLAVRLFGEGAVRFASGGGARAGLAEAASPGLDRRGGHDRAGRGLRTHHEPAVGEPVDRDRAVGVGADPQRHAGGERDDAEGRADVPDLVGQRLPAAEAMLTGAKFRNYQELDVDGRLIIDKDNWSWTRRTRRRARWCRPRRASCMRVRKPTDGCGADRGGPGVVPNVVCAELQAAQDALRSSGFLLLTSKDGTGAGRVPLLDRNWVVIAQSEAPGSKPGTTTLITLTVVKHGEPGGTSGCAT